MKLRVKKHSLKLLSVLLSIFLWVYVLNSERVKFEKAVTLEYVLPDDMLFAERPPQEVIFLIEGPRAFVRGVLEKESRAVIDLNRVNHRRLMDFTVDLKPSLLDLPFGMVVERILPWKLPIHLEKKASKVVPLRAQFAGSLPEQITLAKMDLVPSEVEVTGPRTLINRLKELPTRPIEMDGLLGLTEVPVEVQFPDERMTLVGSRNLKLSYKLKAQGANMVLKDVPIRFLTQNKNVRSVTRAATLKILVPQKIKDRTTISSSVQVWADIPEGSTGQLEVPLKTIIPPGIHLLEISPKSIIVNVQ